MKFKEGDIVTMWLDLDALGFVPGSGKRPLGVFEPIGIVMGMSGGPYSYVGVQWLEASFADRHKAYLLRLYLPCDLK